jgi:hypothetical protein
MSSRRQSSGHMTGPANRIVLNPDCGSWRRRLGPLPWAVLEELALCTRRDETGWVAAIGVRAIAAAVGVTKDTAARAVATLRSAGLVTPDRVKSADGRSLSAYRLDLPDGISIQGCPVPQNSNGTDANGSCPNGEDSRCPQWEYCARRPAQPVTGPPNPPHHGHNQLPIKHQKTSHRLSGNVVQASLFDNSSPTTG